MPQLASQRVMRCVPPGACSEPAAAGPCPGARIRGTGLGRGAYEPVPECRPDPHRSCCCSSRWCKEAGPMLLLARPADRTPAPAPRPCAQLYAGPRLVPRPIPPHVPLVPALFTPSHPLLSPWRSAPPSCLNHPQLSEGSSRSKAKDVAVAPCTSPAPWLPQPLVVRCCPTKPPPPPPHTHIQTHARMHSACIQATWHSSIALCPAI